MVSLVQLLSSSFDLMLCIQVTCCKMYESVAIVRIGPSPFNCASCNHVKVVHIIECCVDMPLQSVKTFLHTINKRQDRSR